MSKTPPNDETRSLRKERGEAGSEILGRAVVSWTEAAVPAVERELVRQGA